MYVVINGVVCMAFDSISGPRQCWSLQKLEMMIVAVFGTVLCLAVLVSILLVVLDTVGLFFWQLVVFCTKKKIIG